MHASTFEFPEVVLVGGKLNEKRVDRIIDLCQGREKVCLVLNSKEGCLHATLRLMDVLAKVGHVTDKVMRADYPATGLLYMAHRVLLHHKGTLNFQQGHLYVSSATVKDGECPEDVVKPYLDYMEHTVRWLEARAKYAYLTPREFAHAARDFPAAILAKWGVADELF